MRWETGSVMCFHSMISIRQIYMKISTALHYHSSQLPNISLHRVLIICLCCYVGYRQFFTIISSAKAILLVHTSLSIETIFLGVREKKCFHVYLEYSVSWLILEPWDSSATHLLQDHEPKNLCISVNLRFIILRLEFPILRGCCKNKTWLMNGNRSAHKGSP